VVNAPNHGEFPTHRVSSWVFLVNGDAESATETVNLGAVTLEVVKLYDDQMN